MLTLWTFPLKIFKKIIYGDTYYLNLSEFLSNVQLTFWAVFMHERNTKTVLQISTYHFVQQLFCQVKVRWVDDVSCNTNFITSGQNRVYSPSVFRSFPEQRKEIISTTHNAICSCKTHFKEKILPSYHSDRNPYGHACFGLIIGLANCSSRTISLKVW